MRVLLVTSRETRRWVIPKGWPMKGRKPHAAAAREAFEEAGVVGQVTKAAVGAYPYMKRLKNGALIPCLVRVYPLQVTQERAAWPEMGERERRWLGVEAAAEAVSEPELAELIRASARAASPPGRPARLTTRSASSVRVRSSAAMPSPPASSPSSRRTSR